jgi:hypothetical protein
MITATTFNAMEGKTTTRSGSRFSTDVDTNNKGVASDVDTIANIKIELSNPANRVFSLSSKFGGDIILFNVLNIYFSSIIILDFQ